MRVLMLADECNPRWPSLPIVAYKACKAIGEEVDVIVATGVKNREAIGEAGMGRCGVEYINNEYIAAPMYQFARLLRGKGSVGWTTNVAMAYPAYLAFEYEVWKKFGSQIRKKQFDVIHRITPMSPTIPSPLSNWCDVPFVIGPLNGGLRWPKEFANTIIKEREWLVPLRNAYRLLPYHRSTLKNVSAILAAFQHTIDDLPAGYRSKMIDFPEIGIDNDLFVGPIRQLPVGQLNFIFVGRLVPYKCPDIAVQAFAKSPILQQHRLRIVGDGPERGRLESIVRDNKLDKCVEFLGMCSQEKVAELMRSSDVFVFPSIRELGAGVVIEAMACGLACVVVDYGAPGHLVDVTRGLKVPLGTSAQLLTGFTDALVSLTENRQRMIEFGNRSREFVLKHFTWEEKAKKTVEVYQWVVKQRQQIPTFYN